MIRAQQDMRSRPARCTHRAAQVRKHQAQRTDLRSRQRHRRTDPLQNPDDLATGRTARRDQATSQRSTSALQRPQPAHSGHQDDRAML